MEVPSFKGSEEEIEYYKILAADYKKRLSETQQELEEYQEGSRDLETELEVQLEQVEAKNKELLAANQQLKLECERLQSKLSHCQEESTATISNLKEEVEELKLVKEDMAQYIRKLEQKNDDFERATRASLMSLEDFESRLNQAIERNAFLENELDEKENMAVLIQRLKDEARDLKQELSIHDNNKNELPQSPTKNIENVMDSNRLISEAEAANKARLRKSITKSPIISNSPNVPHSALNIVGDLLKKVGILESKLQSCRDCIKENSSDHINEKRVSSALNSSRLKYRIAAAREILQNNEIVKSCKATAV